MKRIVFGTFLGGLTLFLWTAISWMALPWHTAGFRSFSNEDVVAQALIAGAKEPGMYTIPGNVEGRSTGRGQAIPHKIADGPFLFASVRPGPMGSMSALIARQVAIQFATAFVLVLLLLRAVPGGFIRRVWFVTGVGLAGGIASHVTEWNWWGFAPGYTTVEVLDMVIGFALAGCVIARFIPAVSEKEQKMPARPMRAGAAAAH